ncbi:helix-turn-helix domain-containing protein [Flavobacteriaceae bacterium]|nr:helix-turn-helix domain-containing protein [Flavobacteriaceae bacterium]
MKTHGARIAYLRKQAQLSQEELAQQLGLVRTTLAVMETNKRKITIEELQKFAAYFQLSLDELVDEQFPNTLPSPVPKKKSATIRMHIPAPSLSKMEQVVLYVLQQCAGKPNVGETALYKLLYFSDFNYYEQYEEHLSGASYKKLQHGPEENSYDNPIQYTNDPLLSGYISEEQLELLKESVPFKVKAMGRGSILLMTDNTNFRAFWLGTQQLYANMLFYADFM